MVGVTSCTRPTIFNLQESKLLQGGICGLYQLPGTHGPIGSLQLLLALEPTIYTDRSALTEDEVVVDSKLHREVIVVVRVIGIDTESIVFIEAPEAEVGLLVEQGGAGVVTIAIAMERDKGELSDEVLGTEQIPVAQQFLLGVDHRLGAFGT